MDERVSFGTIKRFFGFIFGLFSVQSENDDLFPIGFKDSFLYKNIKLSVNASIELHTCQLPHFGTVAFHVPSL